LELEVGRIGVCTAMPGPGGAEVEMLTATYRRRR
jgi:hypothetical protein